MTLNDAIKELTDLRDRQGIPGDTEILSDDWFAVGRFEPITFTEDDKAHAKEINCKVGETVIHVDALK